MMRTLYVAVTTAFWAVVFAFWLGSVWAPHAEQPGAGSGNRAISLSELAQHGRPDSCWMAIRGIVYDLTSYLPDHPSRPEIIERWCGKEATEAYNTKTRGRPHSTAANELLDQYRIGRFEAAPRSSGGRASAPG
jgi:cytochrome b involved in lipid metabolism